MKPIEIKVARLRKGLSQRDMARQLGVSASSYQKKEQGYVRFSDDEKLKITEILGLTYDQFNDIFYDGKLPAGDGSGRNIALTV